MNKNVKLRQISPRKSFSLRSKNARVGIPNQNQRYKAYKGFTGYEVRAAAAWNGDGAQLAFEMSGKRTAGIQMWLYNVGLDDKAENILPAALNEKPGGAGITPDDDIVVIRNEAEKKTYYELRFTAEELQVKGKKFSEGFEFGLGICVNDGTKVPGKTDRRVGVVGIRTPLFSERIRNTRV